MENVVFLAVLFAALCHAGWNALIKVGLDPLSTTTLISIGSGAVALVFLPLTGMPAWDAWPWLIASVVIHLVYFAALIEAYRSGDLGQVYPIARGSAPLMTAAATTFIVGEKLSLVGWSGIVALVAGVFLLSARGGRELAKIDRRAVGFALITALTICTYSVVDGIGARLSANPNAYSLWLFVGIALAVLLCRRRLAGFVLRHRDLGDDGGADRHRRHAARDQRAVRRCYRRGRAQGAATRGAYRRGSADRVRIGADPVTVTKAPSPETSLQIARGRLRYRYPTGREVRPT